MNALLFPVVECGLRVSLVAAAALGGVALAGRRRPAVRAAIATAGLLSILLLTAHAALPLPGWWTWEVRALRHSSILPAGALAADTTAEPAADDAAHAGPASDSAPAAAPAGVPLDLAAAARRLAASPARSAPPAFAAWPTLVLLFLFGGAAFGVLRLGWSLATALRIGRESHPIPEAAVHLMLAETARRLDCSVPPALRESAGLTSAAAVGWLRPAIVLPIQWREWSDEELRGVLAHEVAHVVRRDFLARCAALLAAAVHFYHPLVRRLTRHVVLNQELSADELAARAAGGPQAYLQALSRLALREDDRSRSGTIAGLLPVFSGFLIRRIEMLQAMSGLYCVRRRRWGQWIAVSLLVSLSIAVAGVRGSAAPPPADEPGGAQTRPADARGGDGRQGVPLDAGDVFRRAAVDPSAVVLPEQSLGQGAFVIRVADILNRPGVARKLREMAAPALADDELHWYWKDLFESAEAPNVGLEDIDSIIGNLHMTLVPIGAAHPEAPRVGQGDEARQLAFGWNVMHVRLKRPLDWAQFARSLPKATEVHVKAYQFGYLKLSLADLEAFAGIGDREPVCLFPGDERTVVITIGEHVARRELERRAKPSAAPDWIAHWKATDGGLVTILAPNPAMAVVLARQDLTGGWLLPGSERLPASDGETGVVVHDGPDERRRLWSILEKSPCLGVGIDWAENSDVMALRFHLACGAETPPREACDLIERLLLAPMRQALREASKGAVDEHLVLMAVPLALPVQFFNSAAVGVFEIPDSTARAATLSTAARLPLESLLFDGDDTPIARPPVGP